MRCFLCGGRITEADQAHVVKSILVHGLPQLVLLHRACYCAYANYDYPKQTPDEEYAPMPKWPNCKRQLLSAQVNSHIDGQKKPRR